MILFTWNWLFALIISTIINLSSAAPASLSASAGAAFKNNSLLITNLSILDPFQADPKASDNSTLSCTHLCTSHVPLLTGYIVTVADPDYPDLSAVRCVLSWKAGMAPPSQAGIGCENTTTRVWFPQNTYKGVTNFQLEIAHLVLDSRWVQT